ncbi:olfactory receptor 11A1-like [Periophthalmus magnuspinnatus]|uniref:olfactory receptor 11A1-like n=1 Tax=Periophthalmus magnuspinnatus TaxID=409849 RepID=UPI00145A57FF|nr:olfactory receptor 11A1-like [Periophthalmus magnuspinnatus]
MNSETNATVVTIGGYVEVEKYKFAYFFTMLLVYIVIICSNVTIVCLIWIHQNLHEPMYIFIAALLCNSVLFSSVIYPKMMIDVLSEKQVVTYSACIAQCFLYYSLNGSEFLLLAAMAYDRFVSICKPLQYPNIMGKSTVYGFLVLAWLVPSVQISVPNILIAKTKLCNPTLKGIYCNNLIYKLHCTMSKAMSIYGVVVLINVAILPVFFILFTYAKIFVITYRSCKEVRKKAAETCLPHLFVLINFSCLLTYDVVTVKLEFDVSKTVRLIMTLQVVLYHPLVNPIIYGLKMKEISKHLKRLFTMENVKMIE